MATEQDFYQYLIDSKRVNPWISYGVPIAGSIASLIASEQARRRAQQALSGLSRPTMGRFRQDPLLAQRIASQMRMADQPRMGYQRAFSEQAARDMARARDVAANLGGGRGLAYLQQASSNAAQNERAGIFSDMEQQRLSRAELDRLIGMRNQELQQERALDAQRYAQEMQNYINERRGLQADISQQRGNTWATIGNLVQSIPGMVQQYYSSKAAEKILKGIQGNNPAGKSGKKGAPKPAQDPNKSYIPYNQTKSPVFQSDVVSTPEQPMVVTEPSVYANPFEAQMFSRLGFPGLYSPNSYLNRMPEGSYIPSYSPLLYTQTQSPVFQNNIIDTPEQPMVVTGRSLDPLGYANPFEKQMLSRLGLPLNQTLDTPLVSSATAKPMVMRQGSGEYVNPKSLEGFKLNLPPFRGYDVYDVF